jgi:hypothetical protein
MGKPKKPQTLEVGDYFKTEAFHKDGIYKVIKKTGNFYLVYSKAPLKGDCHTMYDCPFRDQKDEEWPPCAMCKAKDSDKANGWPVSNYTCFLLNPANVTKVPKLIGLMDFGI